jgi:large subunit ribosomal protein L24
MAVIKLHVKKNDLVMIVAGKDKGKSGKVLRVMPDKGRVVVENLKLIKRHTRPSRSHSEGGIIEKEAPIAISNVQLLCQGCKKPARTGIRALEDGSKVRFCKKCNEIVNN